MQANCLSRQPCSPQCFPGAANQISVLYLPGRLRRRDLASPVAARPKVASEESSIVDCLERSLHLQSAEGLESSQHSAEARPSRSGSRRTVDEGEVLHSTNEHRAWVYGATALFSATLIKGISEVHSWQGAVGSAAAVLCAYYVSGAHPPPPSKVCQFLCL